jgi:hypothetical protein
MLPITVLSDSVAGHQLSVLVDANAPVLRIVAAGRGDKKPFDVTASLEIYAPAANWRRNETRSYGQLYAAARRLSAPLRALHVALTQLANDFRAMCVAGSRACAAMATASTCPRETPTAWAPFLL